jgi:hypothetical protein
MIGPPDDLPNPPFAAKSRKCAQTMTPAAAAVQIDHVLMSSRNCAKRDIRDPGAARTASQSDLGSGSRAVAPAGMT